MNILFYILGFITIACSLLVILSKHPINSIIFLIITYLSITCHYIILNAEFIAIANVIVYAGAIMILFLFVLMFINLNILDYYNNNSLYKRFFISLIGIISFIVIIIFFINPCFYTKHPIIKNYSLGSVKDLGLILFKDFIFPFELTTIIFFTTIIGILILTKFDN